jgi:hypothetical protein
MAFGCVCQIGAGFDENGSKVVGWWFAMDVAGLPGSFTKHH